MDILGCARSYSLGCFLSISLARYPTTDLQLYKGFYCRYQVLHFPLSPSVASHLRSIPSLPSLDTVFSQLQDDYRPSLLPLFSAFNPIHLSFMYTQSMSVTPSVRAVATGSLSARLRKLGSVSPYPQPGLSSSYLFTAVRYHDDEDVETLQRLGKLRTSIKHYIVLVCLAQTNQWERHS